MLTIKAPAKINWYLKVTSRRDDGFHEIQSFMQCVSLFDTLTFSESDDVILHTDADIPKESNLVYRAARLMQERYSISQGVTITLDKSIPLAAGLGGGSSDAATTLLGLNDLWSVGATLQDLFSLGAELGSDVPFFISGGPSLISGRGEVIIPLMKGPVCAIALIKPLTGVSAGTAYKGINTFSTGSPTETELRAAIDKGELNNLLPMIVNDLEVPVFNDHPEIEDIKNSLARHGALVSLMSGSGSTVFGAFDDEDAARIAVEKVTAELNTHLWSQVVRTI